MRRTPVGTGMYGLIQTVTFRQHALVQYAGDTYAVGISTIKDNVFVALRSQQTRCQIVTAPIQRRVLCDLVTVKTEIGNIYDRLLPSPHPKRVSRYLAKIVLCLCGEPIHNHRSGRFGRESEFFKNLLKRVPFNPAAGVSLGNSGAKGRQLRLVHGFFPLQAPQAGAHHIAGVFKAACRHAGGDKGVEFIG